ncbi:MAG: hypothetical protein D6714_07855 [Bacteroidetes bacterium]|nr:MAG: hypothetical protein D6714_07855 [Bacteroidota bacterium]
MKTRRIFTLFALFIPLFAFGQLQKGDWFAGGGMDLQFFSSGLPGNSLSQSLYPKAGLMLTDRWMAGTGLIISYSNSPAIFESENIRVKDTYLGIEPFVRYYFNKPAAFRPFAYGTFGIQHTRDDAQILSLPASSPPFSQLQTLRYVRFYGEAGLGFDYFVAPGVAIEGLMGINYLNKTNSSEVEASPKNLFFRAGLQTFLSNETQAPFDIRDTYFQKGNRFLGGTINFSNELSSSGTTSLFFSPEYQEFVTDRVKIGGGLKFSYFHNNAGSNYRSFEIGAKGNVQFYLPITKRLFLSPGTEISLSKSWSQNEISPIFDKDSIVVINGQIVVIGSPDNFPPVRIHNSFLNIQNKTNLTLQYFALKNLLLSGGVRFQYNYSDSGNNSTHRMHWDGFAGAEYFLTKNLSLRGEMSWKLNESEKGSMDNHFNKTNRHQANFHVGFNYFLPTKSSK